MIERFFPFTAAPKPQINAAAEDQKPNLSKNFKIKALGLGFTSGLSLWGTRVNTKQAAFEESPYDFDTILKAIDTDSYVKQAFWKYRDLFWKEGWDIVGENPDAVNYLYQRLDLFEEAMRRPINDFLVEVVDQLTKFGNAFIVKSYGSLDPYYRVSKGAGDNGKSIVGLYCIPVETVRILRDRFNRPVEYKQSLTGKYNAAFNNDLDEPTWKADEVIHLNLDKKPGYAFGTPFVISALDDVIALRQIEQDVQNLIHRELFPLYKYKVGLDGQPASPEELENAAEELANLRVEGGLILPERHDVEVIGAENNALKIESYLNHFKERVAVGLGVYPHHLGMATEGTNRSATDRLDTALYDRVKLMQQYCEEAFRVFIFNEVLREGGFRPMTSPKESNVSDRCFMRFREIDIDTQIKQQNHTLNLFNGNAIDWNELRQMLSLPEDADPNLLFMVMQTAIQTQSQLEITKANAVLNPKPAPAAGTPGAGRAPKPAKPDAIPSSTGGLPNLPNVKKDTGNKVAPSNQFGRRLSPNIRRSDDTVPNISESLLQDVVELIDDESGVDLSE